MIHHPLSKLFACNDYEVLAVLPGNSRVFVRASRLHDELFAGKLVFALQVFADKAPRQRTLDVKAEVVRGFADRICAKGGFVFGLRLLHRRSIGYFLRTGLRVPIPHLHRHVAVACVHKQPGAVSPVNFPVRACLFEPCPPPRSDKRSRIGSLPLQSFPLRSSAL
jgi:hypothetical protein